MLRLIGDVHGKIDQYISLAKDVEYSIQLGDMGFNYNSLTALNPANHRAIAGNHDNYGRLTSHFLGDYGLTPFQMDGEAIFFIRGGRSIDQHLRVPGVSWFWNEELSYFQMMDAIAAYSKAKPAIVLSHECPARIVAEMHGATPFYFDGKLIEPSRTAIILEEMLAIHRPKLWVFGHHRRSWAREINGCKFRCLAELEVYDL